MIFWAKKYKNAAKTLNIDRKMFYNALLGILLLSFQKQFVIFCMKGRGNWLSYAPF